MDFTVTIKPTFDEYKRFNRAVQRNLSKSNIKRIVLFLLLLLIAAFLFWFGEPLFGSVFLIAWIVLLAFAYGKTQRDVKKVWESNAALREGESVLRFTESGLDVTSSTGYAHLEYDKLYRLIETKTHFYLMTSINTGSGFSKSLCTPEQQTFIREHCAK